MLNIARNAAQALSARRRGGHRFRTRALRQVTIRRQRHKLALELQVIDDGPGVPEEIRDRIFNPLVSGREGGTGLGLSLAQTFVHNHQGVIEFEVAAGPNGIQDTAAAEMKPVWIVDDDRSIRWVFEKALSREGIAFNSFASAQRGARRARAASSPQVLVSDIRMPGRSGIELLQAVKERHPAVPVIVMTAYSDLDRAVAAFQGGAYEYLPKPFDVDQAVEPDPARAGREPARDAGDRNRSATTRKSSARRRRCRRCSAPSAGFRSRAPRY